MNQTNTNQNKPISKVKSVDEMYQMMEHKKHIFEKPDTYVGSCDKEIIPTPVYSQNDGIGKIIEKELSYSPGWYKCFDELIVNSHDHKKRMEKKNYR